MITDQTDNNASSAKSISGPVMLVNIFTPKAGQAQAFIDAQTAEYRRLQIPGWIGNRLCRAVDGTKIVNVAQFESIEAYNQWRESSEFAAHVAVIQPFVEEAAPGLYEILYSAGEL